MNTTFSICSRIKDDSRKICDYEKLTPQSLRVTTIYIGIGTLELARKIAAKYRDESGLKGMVDIWIEADGDESGIYGIE